MVKDCGPSLTDCR